MTELTWTKMAGMIRGIDSWGCMAANAEGARIILMVSHDSLHPERAYRLTYRFEAGGRTHEVKTKFANLEAAQRAAQELLNGEKV